MNERNEAAASAYPRDLINQAKTFGFHLRERRANVIYSNCDVVDAWTPFSKKLTHRRILAKRFQQLDV